MVSSPWKLGLSGWWRVLLRVWKEVDNDNLSLIAAGTAFFAFLAIFPALASLFAVYGLITSPSEVEQQLASFTTMLPPDAAQLLLEQMRRLAETADSSLGWGALLGLGISVWSANKGMSGLVRALNIAYDTKESRNFLRFNALTLALTFGGVLTVISFLVLIAGVPVVLGRIGLGGSLERLIALGRWPLLALLLVSLVGVLYHIGPNRPSPRWRWVTPGSLSATILFLVASAGFSFYVSRFGSYNETYGSVAAVAVLMLWLYMGAFVVLLGAELNTESERQANVLPEPEAGTEDPHPEAAADHASGAPSGIRVRAADRRASSRPEELRNADAVHGRA